MAADNFSQCLKRVLVHEGGYSNHPNDPGGVTLEGVIQRVYDGYRDRKGLPRKPLTRAMRGTPEWNKERDDIYRANYWNIIRGDELPRGVDLVVFDGAVNSGPVQSVKWLQRALRMGQVDGHLGAATLAAVSAHKDHDALIRDACARRMAFLQQLRTWPVFGRGWERRVAAINATAQAWSETSPARIPPLAPEPDEDDEGDGKALPSDLAEPAVPVGQSGAATGGGTVLTGALEQVQDATRAIEPLSDSIKYVKWLVMLLTAVAAGIMLYGIYRSWKVARAREGEDREAV